MTAKINTIPTPSEQEVETSLSYIQKGRRSLKHNHAWRLLTLPLLFFILIPIVALITRTSIPDLLSNLNNEQVSQAIRLSLFTSLVTMVVTVLFGTPVAYFLAHRQYKLHRLVDTLIDLPTVLPPSVAGVALLMAFGRNGLLGGWFSAVGLNIPFTMLAVIMAQTFIAAPFYVKSAAIGFSAIDCELKQAAALDGADSWLTFRYIVLPMSWMAMLSGSVMTWARALGEFGATIIFAGNFPGRTQTMPLAIYMGFEIDMNVALTLSVILICLAFLTLMVVKGILHSQIDYEVDSSTRDTGRY
jgi:molybdate transport system permease protein